MIDCLITALFPRVFTTRPEHTEVASLAFLWRRLRARMWISYRAVVARESSVCVRGRVGIQAV